VNEGSSACNFSLKVDVLNDICKNGGKMRLVPISEYPDHRETLLTIIFNTMEFLVCAVKTGQEIFAKNRSTFWK
jgi:hypothetical protein